MHSLVRVSMLLLALAAAPCLATAQGAAEPVTAKNSVYLELGGNAVLYSFNYERQLVGGLGVRAGLSVLPVWFPFVTEDEDGNEGALLVVVPVGATMLTGSGNHHLELGAGLTFGNASIDINSLEGSENWSFATGTIGYRYQRPEGGRVIRVGFIPIFVGVDELDMEFIPMIGLSIGRSF